MQYNNYFVIFVGSNSEAEEMVLDLRDHGSNEAVRLLKCHLSSFSGIPCKLRHRTADEYNLWILLNFPPFFSMVISIFSYLHQHTSTSRLWFMQMITLKGLAEDYGY